MLIEHATRYIMTTYDSSLFAHFFGAGLSVPGSRDVSDYCGEVMSGDGRSQESEN